MQNGLFTKQKIFFFIFFIILFLFPVFHKAVSNLFLQDRILILEQTPWFKLPVYKNIPDGIFSAAEEFPVLEHRRIACIPVDFNNGGYFPVDFVLDMYKVRRSSAEEVWVSPDLVFNHGKTQIYTFGQNRYLPYLFSSLFGLLLTFFCFNGILKKIFSAETAPGTLFIPELSILIFLKQFLLALYLSASECIQAKLGDELSYLKIGYELFHSVTEKWSYPIGFPLLAAPVVAVTGNSPDGIQRAAEWISVFNGFVLFPLVYVILAGILYYFSGSVRRTFLILLGLILLPFFVFPSEDFVNNIYTQWIDIPLLSISYKSYYTMMWTSFNTLSDPASAFFVILSVFYALFRSRGLKNMLIVSALFSFSCLIRINNIFYAMLFAYLFLSANKETYRQDKYILLRDIFCCFCIFVFVFFPQFYVNYRDFSSIWTFPYVLHDTASRGFEYRVLFQGGMKYYTGCNQVLFAFACASLFLMEKGFCRTFFILWIVPLVLFFSGYVCFSASPIRFILPGLLAAGCAAGCCKKIFEEPWGKMLWGCFFLLLSAACISFNPYCHQFISHVLPEKSFFASWQFIKCMILFTAALPVCFCWFKYKKPALLYFILVFLFLMFTGILLWAALLLLLVMAVADFIQEFCGLFLFGKKLKKISGDPRE